MQFNIYIFTQTLYHHFVAFQVEEVKGGVDLERVAQFANYRNQSFLVGQPKTASKAQNW